MLTTNRVAKLVAVGRMEIFSEDDVPEPAADEMLVRVQAAGICGSDLHYFRHGGLGSFKQPLPMPMGHEPAGTVVDPNGHPDFAVGDRVAIAPGRPCLTSAWSLKGRHNLCKEGSFMGSRGHPGCFSDYVCVSPLQCCKLPPSISFEAAALLEPVGVALHAANLVDARFDDTAAIFGAGTIGLCCFLILKRLGIATVFMVDRVPFRRRFAADFGASAALSFEEAVAGILRRTGGLGCSLVLDTVGDDASLEACLQVSAVGATLGLLAIPECDHLAYNPHQARAKELRVINVHRSRMLLREVVNLFSEPAALVALERLVTHRMVLSDVDVAFKMASGYTDGVIKIMLRPGLPPPRQVRRIGLLGDGAHTWPGYLEVLLQERDVEVCFAASVEGEREDTEFAEVCRRHGVPHFCRVAVPGGLERLVGFGCDIALVGPAVVNAAAAVPTAEGPLRKLAREGLLTTHLGVLPANADVSPALWAALRGLPPGATTHFVAFGAGEAAKADAPIVDIFELCDAQCCGGSSGSFDGAAGRFVRERLRAEVIRRVPRWLSSLRTGIFDMSAMRIIRRARRLAGHNASDRGRPPELAKAPPNDSFVSWRWRCAFLERFSEALDGRIRSRRHGDDDDIWFCVSGVSPLRRLDALPPEGSVISVSADGSGDFVVRAADGLVMCRAEAPSAAPQAGCLMTAEPPVPPWPPMPPSTPNGASGGHRGIGGYLWIPADFAGEVWGQPPPPTSCPAPVQPVALVSPAGVFASSATPLAPSDSGVALARGAAPESTVAVPAPLLAKGLSLAIDGAWTGVAVARAASPAAPTAAKEGPEALRKVPIFDLRFDDDFVAEFQAKAADVLTSGRPLSESRYCREFEAAFAKLVRAPYAVVTTCGTMALNIALRSVGVAGKLVITPSNTFFATQVAVQNAGGRCVMGECEAEYMQLCPKALRTQLQALPAQSVAAVVLVHIGGVVAPFAGEIRDIAHEHGAALVEDAAHAHTSHLDGVGWAGTIGDIAAFSFFPTKVMTMGEGGVITTESPQLHQACREIKQFGADLSSGASRLVCARGDGTNGRVPEMSALLGLLECDRVAERVARRQALVGEYAQGLNGCSAYDVLQQPGGFCSYYKCIVRLREGIDREALRRYAAERGVSFTGEVYHLGVHRMGPFATEDPEQLPVTDAVCASHVCPPLYPELTAEDVRFVCRVMRDFAGSVGVHGAAGPGGVGAAAASPSSSSATVDDGGVDGEVGPSAQKRLREA